MENHAFRVADEETEPDRLNARLPLRWLQRETGKTSAFVIPVSSG
jgi:hypothetical protein